MNLLVPSVSFRCHEGSPIHAQGSVFGGALVVAHPMLKVSKRNTRVPVADRLSSFRIAGTALLLLLMDLRPSSGLGARLPPPLQQEGDESENTEQGLDRGHQPRSLARSEISPATISSPR